MSESTENNRAEGSGEPSVDYDGLLAAANDDSKRVEDPAKAEAMARAEAPYQNEMRVIKKNIEMGRDAYTARTAQRIDQASERAADRFDVTQAAAANPEAHLESDPVKAEAMARAADPHETKALKHDKKQLNAEDLADGLPATGLKGTGLIATALEARAAHHQSAAEKERAKAEQAAQEAAREV